YELQRMGYDDTRLWFNQAVDPEDWVDESISYGNDSVHPYGTDWADAVFLSTHGKAVCEAGGKWSQFVMGDQHDGHACSPNTLFHIKCGKADGNVAVFIACQSAQVCLWEGDGYDYMDFLGSFAMWNGCHGLAWDTSDDISRLRSYLQDSVSNGFGDNW